VRPDAALARVIGTSTATAEHLAADFGVDPRAASPSSCPASPRRRAAPALAGRIASSCRSARWCRARADMLLAASLARLFDLDWR